jgi:hypothetical protein
MGNRIDRSQNEERVIHITEVNTSARIIIGTDQYGTQLRISTTFHDPVLSVPSIGEVWTIQRRGIDWFLDRRNDSGTESVAYEDLEPGDKRIDGNNIYINGNIMINGQSLIDLINQVIQSQ